MFNRNRPRFVTPPIAPTAGRLWYPVGTLLVFLLCMAPGELAAQTPDIKLAVVDLQRVILQSAAGKELQARLERFQAEVRSEIRTKLEAANAIRDQAAESGPNLTFEQRSAYQKQFEDAQIAIRRYQDDKQREGRKIEEEGLKQIEKQLQPVFEKIREELGYDLILNNIAGVVVMARGKVDITETVIEKLNSMN